MFVLHAFILRRSVHLSESLSVTADEHMMMRLLLIYIYDRCPKTVNANNVQAQQCKLNRFDVNLKVFPHPCSNLGVRPVWDIRTVSFTSALQTSKVMLTIQLGCWLAWTGVY